MSKSQSVEYINALREQLKPGDTVYTQLNHVSRSGLTRHIEVKIIRDNQPLNATYQVGKALDYRIKNDGLVVSGAGMDMGFHLIYSLSRVLFPHFECIGKDCPSNDHSNGDRKYSPHAHSDGGYALRHRWL